VKSIIPVIIILWAFAVTAFYVVSVILPELSRIF